MYLKRPLDLKETALIRELYVVLHFHQTRRQFPKFPSVRFNADVVPPPELLRKIENVSKTFDATIDSSETRNGGREKERNGRVIQPDHRTCIRKYSDRRTPKINGGPDILK